MKGSHVCSFQKTNNGRQRSWFTPITVPNRIAITMLGKRLKKVRMARGLTQVSLAKHVSVTQGYIAQLEGGYQKDPSLVVLRRLAKALGSKVSELVD